MEENDDENNMPQEQIRETITKVRVKKMKTVDETSSDDDTD